MSLILVISLSFSGFSQEKSLLWKISGNGLKQDSYLFGTIHVICKGDFLMDERIQKAFDKIQSLVMELDMSDPQLAQSMQQQSLNPGMKNIQSELSEEDAKILDSFFTQNYGVGLAQIGILKPFVLSSMALLKTLPCTEVESYENYFTAKAKESGKTVVGLESVEIQVGIFDQIPTSIQIQELVKMISGGTSEAEFDKLVDTYTSQDVEGLFLFMTSEGMMKDYRETILDRRNISWIPTLQERMKKESLFVAVGAGHLGGESGVISLLKKAGYQVEAVLN